MSVFGTVSKCCKEGLRMFGSCGESPEVIFRNGAKQQECCLRTISLDAMIPTVDVGHLSDDREGNNNLLEKQQ